MRSTSTYLFLMNLCFLAAFLMLMMSDTMMSDTMVGNISASLLFLSAVIFMITAFRVSKRKRPNF